MAGASAQTRTIYSVTVPTEIEYDTNPRMSVGDSPSTTWLRVTPSLTAGYVYGNHEYSLEAALAAEKSSNSDVAEDRLDPRFRGAWKYADGLNTAQLAAVLERRAFRDLDVREIVPTGVDGSRTLFGLSGSWTRELSERTSFRADLRQDWERYSDVITPDFRSTAGSLRFTRRQDESRSWYAGVNGYLYRPDEVAGTAGGTRSTAAGGLIGITQSFSEALRIDANAGLMHFTEPTKDDDWQGSFRADYTGERWLAGLEVSRAPSVNTTLGRLVVNEALLLRLRYDLGALTRLEVDAGYSSEKAAQSKRSRVGIAVVRQWSPTWHVSLKGSTDQLEEGPGGTARSNRLSLQLVYSNPDF